MSNPNKAKGSAAERAVVTYLRQRGWPHAERRLAGSAKDRGDIAGVIDVVIEVKAGARCDLAGWLDEATVERDNDRAALGVVWHRRRGVADPGRWYVTMDGAAFAALLTAAGYGGATELGAPASTPPSVGYREAAARNGLAMIHTCGHVEYHAWPPTDGGCDACESGSDNPADWRQLYIRNEATPDA